MDDCDIGIMLGGEGSVVRGNYVHDLVMGIDAPPGVDPNLVGGAEGIFINASNREVAYNSFVNCEGPADWVGSNGGCDGGATEISVAAGGVIDFNRTRPAGAAPDIDAMEFGSSQAGCLPPRRP